MIEVRQSTAELIFDEALLWLGASETVEILLGSSWTPVSRMQLDIINGIVTAHHEGGELRFALAILGAARTIP